MAWHLTGDKPLSEPMMAYFTDAYVSFGLNELKVITLWADSFYSFLIHFFQRVSKQDGWMGFQISDNKPSNGSSRFLPIKEN